MFLMEDPDNSSSITTPGGCATFTFSNSGIHAGAFGTRWSAIASICRRPASLDLRLAFRWPISRARKCAEESQLSKGNAPATKSSGPPTSNTRSFAKQSRKRVRAMRGEAGRKDPHKSRRSRLCVRRSRLRENSSWVQQEKPHPFHAAASATKDLSRVFTPWSHAVALIYQHIVKIWGLRAFDRDFLKTSHSSPSHRRENAKDKRRFRRLDLSGFAPMGC